MTGSRTRRLPPAIRQRSRSLRHPQTPAESKLWSRLRGCQLVGLKFRRQHPIGAFIVDFYCASHRLVVEIDGESHAAQVEYDRARTDWLQANGYRVIRFTNAEVNHQLESVLEAILRDCMGE